MRRFLRKVLVGIVPFLFIAVVNLVVDPLNLFPAIHGQRFDVMVSILGKGKWLAYWENVNERFLVRHIILARSEPPNTVVLGSSRAMQIGQEVVAEPLENSAVSGACLQDILVISEFYFSEALSPRKFIVVMDPWFFNKSLEEIRWTMYAKQFKDIAYRIGLDENAIGVGTSSWSVLRLSLVQLLSPDYFLDSLRYLKDGPRFEEADASHSRLMAVKPDGSLIYGNEFRERAVEKIEKAARDYSKSPIYRIEDFDELDPEYQTLFEAWIEYLIEMGIEVEIVLMPYHPIVYQRLQEENKYAMVDEAEAYLRRLTTEKNIGLRGSYCPNQAGFQSDDFYDGMHPKREAVVRMFSASKPDAH